MMIKNVLALGAGAMGSQPGFYYAMAGFNVTQFDISEEALAACKAYHRGYVEGFRAAFPAFTDEDIDAGLARISYSADLESAATDIDFVTESVPEVLEIKQQVYADLNRYCPEHTIFATNTSTMPPSAIAPSTGRSAYWIRWALVSAAMSIACRPRRSPVILNIKKTLTTSKNTLSTKAIPVP
jgi:3-hydroxybutyryl-CoA dehydrogenase